MANAIKPLGCSILSCQGGEAYFPIHIGPQPQAALTGNHFPTVCSSWTDPSQPRPWGMTRRISLPEADLQEKFHADTVGLRKQMMVKEAELAALWGAEKPDQAAIQAKQKELNVLRDQMQEKMTAIQFEVKKIAPDYDMGRGMSEGMGHGPGKDMGRGPGGGAGPGNVPQPPAK